MGKSYKTGLERFGYLLDHAQHMGYGVVGKKNVFNEDNVRRDLSYHVHLGVRKAPFGVNPTRYFCAEFYGLDVHHSVMEHLSSLIPHVEHHKTLHMVNEGNLRPIGNYHLGQSSVFIPVVQVSQDRERMRAREVLVSGSNSVGINSFFENGAGEIVGCDEVETMIWLKPLNYCPTLVAHMLDHSLNGFAPPILGGVTNWELGVFLPEAFPPSAVNRKLKHGLVESRPQVVDYIPEDVSCALDGFGQVGYVTEVVKMLSCVSVIVQPDMYTLIPSKEFPANMDIVFCNQFFSSTYFPPNIVERVVMSYHVSPESKDKKTQKTKEGIDISIPSKGDFLRDLEKASKPDRKSKPARRPRKKGKKS